MPPTPEHAKLIALLYAARLEVAQKQAQAAAARPVPERAERQADGIARRREAAIAAAAQKESQP